MAGKFLVRKFVCILVSIPDKPSQREVAVLNLLGQVFQPDVVASKNTFFKKNVSAVS